MPGREEKTPAPAGISPSENVDVTALTERLKTGTLEDLVSQVQHDGAHRLLPFGLRLLGVALAAALVIALIGLGVAPRPLADSRFDASTEILRLRQERMSGR